MLSCIFVQVKYSQTDLKIRSAWLSASEYAGMSIRPAAGVKKQTAARRLKHRRLPPVYSLLYFYSSLKRNLCTSSLKRWA